MNRFTKIPEANIREAYEKLVRFLSEYDPIKLITQLSMTYLGVPEGTFLNDSDEQFLWARRIEFITGYYLTKEYPVNKVISLIDGRILDELQLLYDEYFNLVTMYSAMSLKKTNPILSHLKIHSSIVRGDSYPSILLAFAKELYSPHDDWFRANLGFTIADAIELTLIIKHVTETSFNTIKPLSRVAGKEYANRMIAEGKASEGERERIETDAGCYYAFTNSDIVMSLTKAELVEKARKDETIVEKYFARLSQNFGYRNPFYISTFEDALKSVWDYNTLFERPLIHFGDRYYVPLFSVFPTVLLYTFHYDLIGDKGYAEKYNKTRGRWVENKSAECLKYVFDDDEVILNPDYPNEEEFCDVLVLHDRKIFIVQCKSKRLRRESETGENYDHLNEDFEKSIKDSFCQGLRGREYLQSTELPKLICGGKELGIDMRQVTDVFLVSVTFGQYQDLFSCIGNFESLVKLFEDKEYPWAMSVFDL